MASLPRRAVRAADVGSRTGDLPPPYRTHDRAAAPFKEAALVVGRRGGKSRTLATIAVFLACFRTYLPYLAPGEVATVALIAADRKQARVILRYITGLLREVPPLAELIERETGDTITLNTRVVIEIHTASFRVTRGYSFAAVLADELAKRRKQRQPGCRNLPHIATGRRRFSVVHIGHLANPCRIANHR
jgi:phage terminase large subunit-like protein